MNSEEYRTQIDRLIREESGEVVLNGSHAHAAIILERMFSNASQCMEIITRRFDPRIFGTAETIEQAELFLGVPNRACRILVEEINDDALATHPFWEANRRFAESGNLEIRRIPDAFHKVINFNYAVMDDRGFRFEEDKTEAVAFARFGKDAHDFTVKLKSIFAKIWGLSIPVSLKEKQPA